MKAKSKMSDFPKQAMAKAKDSYAKKKEREKSRPAFGMGSQDFAEPIDTKPVSYTRERRPLGAGPTGPGKETKKRDAIRKVMAKRK